MALVGATCSTVKIVQISCPQQNASYKLPRHVGGANATVQLDSWTAVWRAARWEMRRLPAQRSITTVMTSTAGSCMENLQWRCTQDIIQCVVLDCTTGLAQHVYNVLVGDLVPFPSGMMQPAGQLVSCEAGRLWPIPPMRHVLCCLCTRTMNTGLSASQRSSLLCTISATGALVTVQVCM